MRSEILAAQGGRSGTVGIKLAVEAIDFDWSAPFCNGRGDLRIDDGNVMS